jgi:anti-sigma B factor antagonist
MMGGRDGVSAECGVRLGRARRARQPCRIAATFWARSPLRGLRASVRPACTTEDFYMAAYRHLSVNEVGDVAVVRFRDRKIVEDINIQELGQEMFHLIDADNRVRLLLNFSSVEFLSSAALGKLITLEKKMKAHGGTLRLCSIRPEIYEVFAITKLNRVFDIREDEADALAAF